jgi:N-acetylmuramoyl-L-alanine amidase
LSDNLEKRHKQEEKMRKRRKTKYKRRRHADVFVLLILIAFTASVMVLRVRPKPLVQEEVQKAIGIPYTIDSIPESNKRPLKHRRIKYIVVHNTANPLSTARNERDYLVNPINTASTSFHIAVDDKEMIEAIPVTEIAYHAGADEGNEYGIGIEICESGNYKQAEENAIKLIAYLMKEYKIPLSKVTTHQHFTGKPCPRLIIDRWDEFLDKVQNAL